MTDPNIDLGGWPKCAVPACWNKSCRSLRSRYCWPHTPGDALTARQVLLETEMRGQHDQWATHLATVRAAAEIGK